MQRLPWVMIFLALCSCAKHHGTASAPTDADAALYADLVSTLPDFLDDGGWVVSRGQNTNQGDSLYLSGLTMYGLSCDDGEPLAAALEKQLLTGALVRYPGNKDAVSLDGQLGMYRGIAYRLMHCAETDRWHAALAAAKLPPLTLGYDYVRQLVMERAGFPVTPSQVDAARLIADSAAEALDAITRHSACFRVSFSLSALQTVEDMNGELTDAGVTDFCEKSRGTEIPTLENFCGRDDLGGYLGAFKRDVWVYQFQRCPTWETPDAKGDREPGTDALVALQDQELGL